METQNQTQEPKRKKIKTCHTPEGQFYYNLGTCSKNNDLPSALSLYDQTISQNLQLRQNHYDTLLYLCSNALNGSLRDFAIEKGFFIYEQMLGKKINPSEATVTAVGRLAAAKGDGDFAFALVKGMGKYGAVPRLRTYGPALFAFCGKGEAGKAYLVEDHMEGKGIFPEEAELLQLMKVSAEDGRVEKVYEYLQRLRNCVRCVEGVTGEVIQGWFCSKLAEEVGRLDLDEERIREVMVINGGGWHGLGWMGKGKWVVRKSNVGLEGCCCSCREQLVCIDIDRTETEKFAESIASLALKREAKSQSHFRVFQEWLNNNVKYEAVVDGANIGLYQQNFTEGEFSISQLDAVVQEIYKRSGKKWPLIIMHNKRVQSLMSNPSSRELVEQWQDHGALYTTPNGSNDDWYWLYAAVKLKCLLVTNDEMRDHIFELLARSFFLKWKERHRVQFTFQRSNLRLLMPPSYSVVIQESEKGSWHVPVEGELNDELSRTWLCITRPGLVRCLNDVLKSTHAPVLDQPHISKSDVSSQSLPNRDS